jgi:hypothetical protein
MYAVSGSERRGPIEANIGPWLMDTGSAIDLVSADDFAPMKHLIVSSDAPLQLWTANGFSSVDKEIALEVTLLGEKIKPYVVQSSPAVLSIGWRCLELGYSFYWQAGKMPMLVCPDGETIELDVIDYVPYMRSKAYSCAARPEGIFSPERVASPALVHVLPVPSSSVGGPPRPVPPNEDDTLQFPPGGSGAPSSGGPLPVARPNDPVLPVGGREGSARPRSEAFEAGSHVPEALDDSSPEEPAL